MNRLDGKTAIITGAAQGIGAILAQSMADEGARVLVTDIDDPSNTVQSIEASGGTASGLKVDVTDNDDLSKMISTAESTYGPVDILVNNASIFAALDLKPFFQITDEEWDRVMRVNARGVFQCCKAVLPSMKNNGGGKIVNISSGTFYYGPPGLSHYTASKAAVIALTRSMGRELGDLNIQVNSIAPGLTESEGIQGNEQFNPARAPTVASRSIKREMLPNDLIGTLLYLCSSDSDFVTGQTLNVDGGKINV
jgi:NAD(P)-dependent dehydrogenase (short-subunit alcohol dehydrogenase family)